MKAQLKNKILEGITPVSESIESDELVLFADNDGGLYRSSTVPIQKNLSKKWKAGKYDHKLAVKLWMAHADRAAKAYAKEFATPAEWNKIFSVKDRKEAAQEFADNWKDEMEAGNLHEESINEMRFKDSSAAIKKAESNIKQLVKMVNSIAGEKKVREDDFLEPIHFLSKQK